MTKPSPYAVFQANSNFKVGDTIEVTRLWTYGEMGFTTPVGGVKIGLKDKISLIEPTFILLEDTSYMVPFFAIKKIVVKKKRVHVKKPTEEQLEKAYVELQTKCNFQEGDYVRVERTAETHEMGWLNSWEPQMTEFVGKVCQVHFTPTDSSGVSLKYNHTVFRFPFFVLTKAEKPWTNVPVRDNDGMVLATIIKDGVSFSRTPMSHNDFAKVVKAFADVKKA